MRLVLISLDLMLALPVAAIAFVLLFGTIIGSQNTLASVANVQNKTLATIVASQLAARSLDSSTNYSLTLQHLRSTASRYGVAFAVDNLSGAGVCVNASVLCRLATIYGASRILVVSHEGAG